MRHPVVRALLPAAMVALALTACAVPAGDGGAESGSGEPTAVGSELTREHALLAAAWRTAAFDERATQLEGRHPSHADARATRP